MPGQIYLERKTTEPIPATGVHAELLEEMTQAARVLLQYIELEQAGTFDGMGERFWTVSDSVLNTAKKLVYLAEQRIGEINVRR
jgi:biotin carboxylase